MSGGSLVALLIGALMVVGGILGLVGKRWVFGGVMLGLGLVIGGLGLVVLLYAFLVGT